VVPFLTAGLAAGEPAVAAFAPANQALVRRAMGRPDGLRYVDGAAQYRRPAGAIRAYRDLFAGYVAGGAAQVRVAGDVPHPGLGVPWGWWARYEAAVNVAYAGFPLWGLCPYDTRTTPPDVLDDVRRTHPRLVGPDGHVTNPDYEAPEGFLAGRTDRWRDPAESQPPTVDLTDPTTADVRAAVATHAPAAGLTGTEVDDLALAATEAVTNAAVHGRPPVRVRLWTAPGRVVVAVTDHGPGPADPYAGLLPATGSVTGGLGLWLAHQLCAYVALSTGPDGFTIRLVAGRPVA
jgi:anti-sigma regulatory factor (Ser/Thr protein kinase)